MYGGHDGYLKSNMDRFIELKIREVCGDYAYLKSNMDRFIEKRLLTIVLNTEI